MSLNRPLMRNGLLLGLVFALLMLPLIFKAHINIYDENDEQRSHYPTILQFAAQFPTPDLVNYDSATAPFYHLFMMIFQKILNPSLQGLRVINLVISLVCLLVVYRTIASGNDANFAVLLTACFALSPYFIGPAIRLSTDNMALLFVFLTVIILDQAAFSALKYLVSSITAALAVLTRQLHVWLIGAGILNALGSFQVPLRSRILNSLFFLIPILALLPLVLAWKGLSPPIYQSSYQVPGLIQPTGAAYGLAVLGQYGIFFAPWFWTFFRENKGKWWHIAALVVIAWVYIALLPITPKSAGADYRTEGGVLWLVAGYLPDLLSTSLLFWVLVPIGLLCLYAVFLEAHRKRNYWFLIFALLWLVADMFSARIYQKYYEPFWLFFLIYIVRDRMKVRRWFWALPALLCIILIGIDVFRFYR